MNEDIVEKLITLLKFNLLEQVEGELGAEERLGIGDNTEYEDDVRSHLQSHPELQVLVKNGIDNFFQGLFNPERYE